MRLLITLIAALALAACKNAPDLPSIISPYRVDIQQGNVITQEMIGKLKAGQTRSQVRFVLGSPLVTDMFHDERWDYIYLLRRQGRPDERRRLTVIFDGDKLLRLEGDIVLTDKMEEPPDVPIVPAPKPAAKPETLKAEAAKAEAAKAAAAKAEAVKAEAAKAEAAKAEAAKAAAAKAEAAKADAVKADAAKAEAAKAAAAKADAAKADAAKVDAAKGDAATADEKKDQPKRGAFGRMLDKIGF